MCYSCRTECACCKRRSLGPRRKLQTQKRRPAKSVQECNKMTLITKSEWWTSNWISATKNIIRSFSWSKNCKQNKTSRLEHKNSSRSDCKRQLLSNWSKKNLKLRCSMPASTCKQLQKKGSAESKKIRASACKNVNNSLRTRIKQPEWISKSKALTLRIRLVLLSKRQRNWKL